MYRLGLALALALALAAAGACAKSPVEKEAEKGPKTGVWVHDETAVAAAKEAGKPALVDVAAAWCTPCREFDRVTFADPAVKKALSNRVLVRLDVTRGQPVHKEIQEKYGAKTLPMVVLFDAEGNVEHRFDRFVGPTDFLAELDRLAKSAR